MKKSQIVKYIHNDAKIIISWMGKRGYFGAIVSLCFAAAIFFRAYNWRTYPLAFDQVQILQAAQSINSGNFTLIGPRTGPAKMFTGPLIYYLTALLLHFFLPYQAIILVALLISVLTGIVLYLLSVRYVSRKAAVISLLIWAYSPLLVVLDRVPWNPNLSLLAGGLVFYPLLGGVKQRQLKFHDVVLLSLGIFLGYQAHFSGLLLLPLMILSLVILNFSKKATTAIFPISAFLLSLLPTIIFDLRHGGINYQGLLSLLGNKKQVGGYQYLLRLTKLVRIILETTGKIVFDLNSPQLVTVVGVLVLGFYFVWKVVKTVQDHEHRLIILWLTIVAISYAFYRESIPEYYFLILVPLLIYIISQVLTRLRGSVLLGSLIFYCVLSSWSLLHVVNQPKGFTLGEQLATKDVVYQVLEEQGIQQLNWDIVPVNAVGLQYLLKDFDQHFTADGAVVHLIFPLRNNFVTYQVSTSAGVWLNPRVRSDKKYLSKEEYIIEYQQECHLLENYDDTFCSQAREKYLLFDDLWQVVGQVCIYDNEHLPEDTSANIIHNNENFIDRFRLGWPVSVFMRKDISCVIEIFQEGCFDSLKFITP